MQGRAEEGDPPPREAVPWAKVAYFGTLFGLVLLSTSLLWNFATTLLPDGDLGFVALAVVAGCIAGASVFSVVLMEAIGVRLTILLSNVLLASFYLAVLSGRPVIVLCGAPLAGLGFATLYNAQSSYCSRLAPPSSMGRVLGLFWTLATCGSILSNLLASVLTKAGVPLRTLFLGGLSELAVPSVLLLALPRLPASRDQQHSKSQGLKTCGRRLIGVWRLLIRPETLALLPGMLYIGTIHSVFAAKINPILGPGLAGAVWMLDTLLRTAVTFPCGLLADFLPRTLLVVLACSFMLGANVGVWFLDQTSRPWLPYVIYCVLALGEAVNWSSFLSPALSRDFGDPEGIYALYRMSWPTGQLCFLLIAPHLTLRTLDACHACLVVLVLLGYLWYCYLRRRGSGASSVKDTDEVALVPLSAKGEEEEEEEPEQEE